MPLHLRKEAEFIGTKAPLAAIKKKKTKCLVIQGIILHYDNCKNRCTRSMVGEVYIQKRNQVGDKSLRCCHLNSSFGSGRQGVLNRPGVSFCTRTTFDDNAITNAIDIFKDSSGAVRFMASNNDSGVREYDTERFQLLNHFRFPWPVNHTTISPDRKIVAVVGDCCEGLLVDSQNGKIVSTFAGHLDYSFATAWHPDGLTFATGNQDKTCRVWDVRNLSSSLAILKCNLGAVRSIRYSSDGRFMIAAEPADFVHIYSTRADYKKRQELDFFGEISGVALSPDDESLFIGVWDRVYASLLQFNMRHEFGYLNSFL